MLARIDMPNATFLRLVYVGSNHSEEITRRGYEPEGPQFESLPARHFNSSPISGVALLSRLFLFQN